MADLSREQMGAIADVVCEVIEERKRQHAKWGEQNHPDGTSWDDWCIQRDLAKSDTDRAAKEGTVTYAQILREEVLEALAESDPARLRAELIQVAAVAVQWVEKLDREARHA